MKFRIFKYSAKFAKLVVCRYDRFTVDRLSDMSVFVYGYLVVPVCVKS